MTRRPRSPRHGESGSAAEVVVDIDKVVAQGDGLGRLADGRVVFVEEALPGERVRVRIVRQTRDFARAVITEVVDSHVERVVPPCPHRRSGCGGCDLQHASPKLQWEIKRDIVVESLERLGKIVHPDVHRAGSDPEVAPGVLAASAKRTTVRLIGDADGRPGFRRGRSNEVIAIDHCLVAHDRLNDVLPNIRLDPGHEVVLRWSAASDVRLVVTDRSTTVVGLPEDVRWSEDHAAMIERIAGVDLWVSSTSFFQSSVAAAEDLVEAVRTALGDPKTWPEGSVVDAYGGVGLFGATVVPGDRPVILIEVSSSACGDATRNLADHPHQIVCGPLEHWTPVRAAVVIADPPRHGLGAMGVKTLAATGAQRMVLVSCDPASLGRDARLLEGAGYRFVTAQVLPTFPHTHHVETVSRFDKKV